MSYTPPALHPAASRRHASRWLRKLVAEIGPGFHPDTEPSAYIDGDGQRLLAADRAHAMGADLERARRILGTKRLERIALSSIWRSLGARFDPVRGMLVPLRHAGF